MKRIHLIINAVLFAGLAVLYFLHFSDISKTGLNDGNETSQTEPFSGASTIAFVNMDTLLSKYDMYFDFRQQLQEKQRRLEAQLNTSTRTYERQVVDFQDKVQKGLVTRSQAQEIEMQLMQKQQELIQLKDRLSMQLMEEEQVMNRRLQFTIQEFLKEYNKDGKFQYILGYSFGGPILYSNEKLDITSEVISGINLKYQASKTQQ